ncbi:MAG: penicillin-binding transpeptidase domain-containing protein [Polyangiales bacterium]
MRRDDFSQAPSSGLLEGTDRLEGDAPDRPDAVTPTPVPTAVESVRADSVAPTAASARERLRSLLSTGRTRVEPIVDRTRNQGSELITTSRAAIAARPRRALAMAAIATLLVMLLPRIAHRRPSPNDPQTEPSQIASASVSPTADVVEIGEDESAAAGRKPYQPVAALAGLDLKSIAIDDAGAVASAANGRVARLTVDPRLQIAVTRLIKKHKVPQAAVVVLEPSTGKVLAYGSRGGDGKDLDVEAFAPSASVFKIVTGAALVQIAGLTPDFKTCYTGGEQKITAAELREDPKRDLYCATLAQAMGRSINTVFARLASKKLTAPDLQAIAMQLGYGSAIPFDVPVEISKIDLPTDTLGFARTAAGFWNTTLSPLHGALLASAVADGGTIMRPWIVSEVIEGQSSIYKASAPQIWHKAIDPATASALETMMRETVSQGTSYKAFHDKAGKPFLPEIPVAGKTGTLNQTSPTRLFTWFVGFAPLKNPKVAIATLVVNDPVWKVKANVLAREVLQAYFSEQGAPGVQSPGFD